MNTFVCFVLLAVVVVAEPPQYRDARFRIPRQEATEGTGDAPYPAAGYKPSKEFNLPSRQETAPPATTYGIPADSYGAPFNTYLTPQTEYGVPEGEKDTKNEEKDTKNEEKDVETVEEPKKEEKENLEEEPKKDAEVVSSQGAYYVLLPGSQLQRVQFQTENDLRNMAYTARLQYRNDERAPLFFYTAVPQYQSAAYVQLYK